MFTVEEFNKDIQAKTLEHCHNIFHTALADGERYYHVHNDKGQDYDISYKGNTEWIGKFIPSHLGKVVPEYLTYDEDDKDSIDIEFLNAFSQYICTKLTEYSIVTARLVLKYAPNSHVYFMDPRAQWFIEPHERLHIGQMPEVNDTTIFLVGALGKGFTKGAPVDENTNKKSDIMVFNSAFIMQDLLKGKKLSEVKYFENPVRNTTMGIGGILINSHTFKHFSKYWGLRLIYNHDQIGKFKTADLENYFNIAYRVDDSNDDNTIYVENTSYLSVYLSWRAYTITTGISKDMLVDRFRNELEAYADAVIAGRKALGVLIRGTDYISTGLGNSTETAKASRHQSTVEEMTPMIRQWVDEYGYEKIILATEDQDILDKMIALFGNKVVAIAQERHSVSDFREGQFINDLEKELYAEEAEFDEHVLDMTVNYFYALYTVAKCNGFICSGQNYGYDMIMALNAGAFEHTYKFSLADNK